MVTRLAQNTSRPDTGPPVRDAMAEGARQYQSVLSTIDPSSDPKAVAVILELWRATHAQYLSNCRAANSVDLPISVTGKRLAILRTLHFAPENRMRLSTLAKSIHLRPAAATNYVESLSRGSLVRRYSDRQDKHANVVELTPKGEAAFLAIVPELGKTWTKACAGFSEEEKDTLVRLLRRLAPAGSPAIDPC